MKRRVSITYVVDVLCEVDLETGRCDVIYDEIVEPPGFDVKMASFGFQLENEDEEEVSGQEAVEAAFERWLERCRNNHGEVRELDI